MLILPPAYEARTPSELLSDLWHHLRNQVPVEWLEKTALDCAKIVLISNGLVKTVA